MLSMPVVGQFEQVLNALYLRQLDYGAYATELTPKVIGAFLERVPEHRAALAGYHQDGNRDLLAALEQGLEDAAAGRA